MDEHTQDELDRISERVWDFQHPADAMRSKFEKDRLLVPIEIIDKANAILDTMIGMVEWPEDDWQSLSPDWDLNLFSSGTDECHATIYRVENGDTKTDRWYALK